MSEFIYDLNEEPIVLPKATLQRLFRTEHPSECMSMYILFYYTAKWQQTNSPKINNKYIQKKLKFGIHKVEKIKKILKEINLIQDEPLKENGKIIEWRTKVNFIFSEKNKNKNNTSNENSNECMDENSDKNHTYRNCKCGNPTPTEIVGVDTIIENNIIKKRKINKKKRKKPQIEQNIKQNSEKTVPNILKLFEKKLPENIFQNENVQSALIDYIKHRKKLCCPIETQKAVTTQTNKIKNLPPHEIPRVIQESITKNWIGLFPKNKTYQDFQNEKLKKRNDYFGMDKKHLKKPEVIYD